MQKIGLIIQARTNSSRLKGKILYKLDQNTLIEWVIKRAKKSNAHTVILATSNKSNNTTLKKICLEEKINFFSGSEENVLQRFYKASLKYKLDAVIRVCADNPFIDSKEINYLISSYKKDKKKKDYYFNHRNFKQHTFADGFGAELIKFQALKKIYKNVKNKKDKEHVTSSIWHDPKSFNTHPCKTSVNKNFHHVVLDINNKHDFDKINRFIKDKKIKIKDSANKIANLYSKHEIKCYLKDLFSFNRSLAGNENRKTLNYLKKDIPLKIKNLKSGLKVFDWKIPKEWKINQGYILNQGKKIIDYKNNNLHVASYSQPIKKKLSFEELSKKLLTHKLRKAIPYRTLYYKKDWAFCLNKDDLKKIKKISQKKEKNKFEVLIDSSFKNGKMNYGEIIIPGKSKKEILISTYICHPSMANDNLSGVILTSLLTKYLTNFYQLNWSYRIVFVPETIGSIAYIHQNIEKFKKIDFGLNISCVGGKGNLSFKESWNSNHFINKLVKKIFYKKKIKFKKYKYDIHGSDERQYSYPGSSVNIVSIHKDKFYDYKEYHTSLDNLDFVKDHQILNTFQVYKDFIQEVEKQKIYKLKNTYSEPMLSKHNLYPATGGSMLPTSKIINEIDKILWVLFKTNGKNTINEIAEKLDINDSQMKSIIRILEQKKIIKHV